MTQQEIAKGILAIGPDISRRKFFAFSRANEFAADSLGIKYLKKANRDPGASWYNSRKTSWSRIINI